MGNLLIACIHVLEAVSHDAFAYRATKSRPYINISALLLFSRALAKTECRPIENVKV
jgi:hypothetical protein